MHFFECIWDWKTESILDNRREISKVLEQVECFYHYTQLCIAHVLDRGGPSLDDSALCPSGI